MSKNKKLILYLTLRGHISLSLVELRARAGHGI